MNIFTKYISFYVYFFIFVNVACRINKSILLKNTLTIDSFNCKDKEENQFCSLIMSKPFFLVNPLYCRSAQYSLQSKSRKNQILIFNDLVFKWLLVMIS